MLRSLSTLIALALATGCTASTDGARSAGGADNSPPSYAAADAGVAGPDDRWGGGEGGGGGEGWAEDEGWGAGGAGGGAGEGWDDGGGWVEPSDLEGGEIDDNADFEGYLDYATAFIEAVDDPMIHWLDVSRRHLITVVDATGQTVPDVEVQVESAAGALFTGRTRADGRLAVHPLAYPAAFDGGDLRATATAGDWTGHAEITEEDAAATLTLDGAPTAPPFRVDIAFVLDATGSMAGELERLKSTIDDIALQLSDTEYAPDLRYGLVHYRDRGDAYVTRHEAFTSDVTAFRRSLRPVTADGGGDTPEALNEALHVALRQLDWRRERTLRLVFVVADAPAHHYADAQYVYSDAMRDAVRDGVAIFPIASGGSDGVAEFQLRQLAQFTQGHFIFVTEGGGSSSGSEGSDYEVEPSDFQVEQLDALIVRLVKDQMHAWHHVAPDAPADDPAVGE